MKNSLKIFLCVLLTFAVSSALFGGGIFDDFEKFNREVPIKVVVEDGEACHDLEALARLPKSELPIVVDVGMCLCSLDSFNYDANTFSAIFWVWFVYDKKYENVINPHSTCEVLNSMQTEVLSSFKEISGGKVWAGKKLKCQIKHAWNMSKYPIDTQPLRIRLEESDRTSDQISYRADTKNSGMLINEVKVQGWEIDPLKINAVIVHYDSNYGDPSTDEGSEYSSVVASFDIHRIQFSTFFKFNIVLIVAFLISWLATLINFYDAPALLAVRVAILVSMIYSIIINIQNVDNIMGHVPITTLPDKMQYATLFIIFLFFVQIVVTYRLNKSGKKDKAILVDKILFWVFPLILISSGAVIAIF